jgi:hypothetical protein
MLSCLCSLEAQIIQQLLVGFQTPKIPLPMLMQLLKFYLFFIVGGEEVSLYAPLVV